VPSTPTVFISYNGDKRYDFPITPERLAKSPRGWRSNRIVRFLPEGYLGTVFPDAGRWKPVCRLGRGPGCSGRCAAPGYAVIEFLESCGPTFALTLPGCSLDLLVVIAVAFAVAGLKRLRAALDDDAESPHFIENRTPARVSLHRGSQWRTWKWSRADCAGGSEAGCRGQACPSLKKWDCSSCCFSCAQDEQ
jgi:hypothetical protein